jgi:hypothetical protein
VDDRFVAFIVFCFVGHVQTDVGCWRLVVSA